MFQVARVLMPIALAGSILSALANLACSTAHAQETSNSTARDSLPTAPQPTLVTNQAEENRSLQTGTGNISGTVVDTNGNVVQGAKVALAGQSDSDVQTVVSGSDGQFAFPGLPPDVYRITVTAPGMNPFTSNQFLLHTGEFHLVPAVTLSVSGGSTSVTVSATLIHCSELP
jgi:Carboxypeptidase regulatory-like domain